MSIPEFDIIEATEKITRRPNFGWHLVKFDEIDSTNKYAKDHAFDIELPALIVAKHQTEGRGRGKNTWQDEGHGNSFLSTWSMELKEGEADPRWTLGIGLYVYEALSEAFKTVRFSLKAPNDIFISDKKVGGILVEASGDGDVFHLHVGLGLNVFSYPTEHAESATHLNAYLGGQQLTADSWGHFIEFFGNRLLHIEKKALANANGWLPRLAPRLTEAMNRHPSYQDNKVRSVKPDGTLVLERGEIKWQEL
jgi:BirA family transcriptional regulator, biotin operon repressor / biotin---[acetyl-CoA-carboxylase] ligase